MALTIVETPITGGVDTDADMHVAAALATAGPALAPTSALESPVGARRANA
jgi:hypothetical protein